MGNEMSRIREIEANPPQDLAMASIMYFMHHGEALQILEPLLGTGLDVYYQRKAHLCGTAPCAAMLGDISTISLFSGHSGVQFIDFKKLGPILLGKTILINGNSGIGKTLTIKAEQKRIRHLYTRLRTLFNLHVTRLAEAAQGDVQMTPIPTHLQQDFDNVKSIDCRWNNRKFGEVNYVYFFFCFCIKTNFVCIKILSISFILLENPVKMIFHLLVMLIV